MRGLFRRDYELFLTTEGTEAVRMVTENEIDVIVADQRMPGMTGIEVLGAVRQKSPRTVRILLTGYADPGAVEGSINIGQVFRFLSKPCPPKTLRETLSLAIEAARTRPVEAEPAVAPKPQPEREPAPEAARPESPPANEGSQAETTPPAAPVPEATAQTPAPFQPEAQPDAAAEHEDLPDLEEPISEMGDQTEPALQTLDEAAITTETDESSSRWQSVTNVVMSEDTVEETQENVALTPSTSGIKDIGVVVFTVDSEFAADSIKSLSSDRNTILATTLVKVAHAIEKENAGVLVTDFTTNKALLQKMIGALKKHLPELVTIVVSDGRDTTDMINLINHGQVFRYVLKPIDPEKLRHEINAAAIHHLYLLNNPDSAKRHQVTEAPSADDASSSSINDFLGRIRQMQRQRPDPTDTTTSSESQKR